MDLIWFAFIAGIIGLVFVIFLAVSVIKKDVGSERIREIIDSSTIERSITLWT